MNGISLEKAPKRFDRNQKNFNLAVDEIKLTRAIYELTGALEKIEREKIQSKRLKLIRKEIIRQSKQLEELRANKSK